MNVSTSDHPHTRAHEAPCAEACCRQLRCEHEPEQLELVREVVDGRDHWAHHCECGALVGWVSVAERFD